MKTPTVRIGTRSSPMALAQAHLVADLLRKERPGLQVELVPVTTEADRWHGDLSALGGKGLFVKQIDVMLQRGEVDLAVHCVKDVPGDTPLPEGLAVAAHLPRDDVRDVLLFPEDSARRTLDDLPHGAVVATSAVRRRAQLQRLRPDLEIVRVRGAVGSRIDKLDGRKPVDTARPDAMVLASSGLARLELTGRACQVFTVGQILPAVGAGALALECRADDADTAGLVARLDHARTTAEVTAERAMLHDLRGHCNSPIAGHCTTTADGRLALRGMVFSADGSTVLDAEATGGTADTPAALGSRVAAALLGRGAREIIEAIPH
ncbi:putative porphobilinogen deaminase [Actinacidiphila reveromycinica]|uniref:Hydroxymethylbilane synthase n=1 Tax=Actinacidiphila reveromycinica TaxID=659352 RepID=A0A7U3UTS2_9ACTN|nr:hydroxymethylbilane synthase [Streptomyces sp. SN-593]BBA98606.1 putative porphobilinogen deaminase [Streptomyces sp. SN-593]